ncbi:MAG: DNA adenine methylase [Candidatus Cloacimonetes bacterium]|nr:DNA adenine methylase [Candidatus Cloacimonadota bacterium]
MKQNDILTTEEKLVHISKKIYPEYTSLSLFDEYCVKMPEPQYLGSKFKHLPWIFKYIPEGVQAVFDGFAGSQSFSFEAKKRRYTVYTNDFMNYSHQIGLALIENKAEILTKSDLFLLFSQNVNKKDLFEHLFKNIFFTENDCMFLDNFRANIELLSNESKKALAFTIINRAMTRKTTMGHFAHLQALNYASDPERVKRNPNIAKGIAEVFLSLVTDYNKAVFDNKKENKSFCGNVLDVISEINVDLAYFDPPYCGSHSDYQSFYHLLETYTEYWENKKFINQNKKYFPLKYSGFDKKTEIINSLKQLLDSAKHIPYVLFSYNCRSYPTIEEFVKIIKSFRKNVDIYENVYTNSRGGKGSVKNSTEYLIRSENV